MELKSNPIIHPANDYQRRLSWTPKIEPLLRVAQASAGVANVMLSTSPARLLGVERKRRLALPVKVPSVKVGATVSAVRWPPRQTLTRSGHARPRS